jgi:hypothetical protein
MKVHLMLPHGEGTGRNCEGQDTEGKQNNKMREGRRRRKTEMRRRRKGQEEGEMNDELNKIRKRTK